jgi:hypothetical protein
MPSKLKRTLLLVMLLFLGGVGVELSAILFINSGHLVYTLDDAYIHLSLAENIRQGHYGVNPGEFCSPSSSILWPLLLAPFAGSDAGTLAPLVMNILASLGTVFLLWRIVCVAPEEEQGGALRSPAFAAFLVLLLIVATNQVGLIFTGMEHSLQVFLVTLIVWGLIQESRTGKAEWWLAVALALAPLVRYECLAISAPGLIYLFIRKHRSEALIAATSLAVALCGFSAFLVHLGLDPLPDSVNVKSAIVSSGGSLRLMIRHFGGSLNNARGSILAAALVALCWLACSGRRKPAERLLAASVASGVAAHLVAGEYGWYSRYEIYIWTAAILSILYLARELLSRRLSRDGPVVVGALVCLTVVLTCFPYIQVLATTPVASNNVYQQQRQMRRFAVDFYRKPIAVNDVGYPSYQNDAYVLDVVGVASSAARKAWRRGETASWFETASRDHDVRLAMIYGGWFSPIADRWLKIGELRLGREKVSVNNNVVGFYARDDGTREAVASELRDFALTLPEGCTFAFSDSNLGAREH